MKKKTKKSNTAPVQPNKKEQKDVTNEKSVESILQSITPEQELFITTSAKGGVDIMNITRDVFNDQTLSGRNAEGKAVREVLLRNNIQDYRSTLYTPINGLIELTEQDKDFIQRNYKNEKNALNMAKTLWPDKSIVQTSKEVLVIQSFVRQIDKKGFAVNFTSDVYNPPIGFKNTMRLVGQSCNQDLEEAKLNSVQKRGIEKLQSYLKSPRFLMIIRSYFVDSERDLFEAEFVRATWDKPDLTPDELNLCINLCQEYITQFRISETQNKLQMQMNGIIDMNDESRKISMSLTEALKDQAEQHHKQSDRQRKLNEQLNGLRKDRIDKKTGGNRNLAQLVEAIQEEDNRKEMLRMAKLYEGELKDEVNRMGSMEEFTARIFGVSEDDF